MQLSLREVCRPKLEGARALLPRHLKPAKERHQMRYRSGAFASASVFCLRRDHRSPNKGLRFNFDDF